MNRLLPAAAVALSLTAISLTTPASAESVADFYRGRQVNLVVAFSAGGMYGLNAELIARYLGKHIPGHPKVVPQFMSGAGGAKAANYLYNAAPRDGSVIGELSKDLAVAQRLEPRKVKYDARKFHYIGRVQPYYAVLMIWHTAGINNLHDLKTKKLVMGESGRESHGYVEAMLLNQMGDAKIKVVLGYRGAASMYHAMESGEIQARIGAYNSLVSVKPSWLSDKLVTTPLQTGLTRAAELPHIPTILELARNKEQRQMVELIEAGGPVGWGIQTPPGVPAARVAALRKAFNALVADPDYVADAKKRKVDLGPATGAEVRKAIDRTFAIPETIVKKLQKIAGFAK